MAYTIDGFYGSSINPCKVFVYDWCGGHYYCVEGSCNVNFTHDPVENGVNVEKLSDSDCSSSSEPLETLEQFEAFIDS